jgi:hypothetical protein
MRLNDSFMWGWYGILIILFFYTFYIVVIRGRKGKHSYSSFIVWFIKLSNKAAAKQPERIASLYDLILVLTWLVLFPYVFVLLLGDGSGHIECVKSFH